jgi:hypothetical protein
MPITSLPIFCYYDVQRFTQFGSMDCANWYGIQVEAAKKQQALYPAMGRKHVNFLNENRLIYNTEPRDEFRTIDYLYVIEGTQVIAYDSAFNPQFLGNIGLTGELWFAYLPVGNAVYALLTNGTNIYIITELGTSVTMTVCTDTNAPTKPQYVAAFGSRFVINQMGTNVNYLTQINLGGSPPVDPSKIFTIPDGGSGFALFFSSSGIVRSYAVLHTQLYIFTDFTTDIWANIATQITVAGVTREFPWKINTSYNWDYGIADPLSLSVDFGRMVWLGKNTSGLVTFMASDGGQPVPISTQAVNVLLENASNDDDGLSPFLRATTDGFLYQYENTIFYRVSAGVYDNTELLDPTTFANSLEYNFETKTWGRVIELNGSRCRIQKHVYFTNRHLVIVQGDPAIYEMAGNIYYNELRNTAQPNIQAADAFLKFPMRYELVTQQIYNEDYSEFIDDYVEIDFVFGDKTFYKNNAPFINTTFIIDEMDNGQVPPRPIYMVTEDESQFIIAEGGNTPTFDDNHYNALFKPHIELYYSDDGGVSFLTADLREFSQLGQYRWRMRWYELAISRNRCYKLVCVSSAPIVILGAVRNTRRASGGAN